MDADAGIGRPGSARDEGDAGAPRQRSVRASHEAHPAFLTADDRLDLRRIMQRVEHREEAFPRHREDAVTALNDQLIDQYAATGARFAHA